MITISPIPESEASEEVKKIYQEIKNSLTLPSVPLFFTYLGPFPEYLSHISQQLVKNLKDTNFLDKFREYVWNILDIKQVLYNNQDFIKRLSKLDLPTYEDPAKNDLMWRTFNRFQMQFKWYVQYITEVLQRLIMFAVIMMIFVYGSPIIAVIVFITHLIPLFIRAKFGEYSFTIYRADSDLRRKFEALQGIICGRETLPEIKLFHSFDFFRLQIVSLYKQFTAKQLQIFKKSWVILSLTELLPIFSIFIFLFYTANRLVLHQITAGTFVLLYIMFFGFPVILLNL